MSKLLALTAEYYLWIELSINNVFCRIEVTRRIFCIICKMKPQFFLASCTRPQLINTLISDFVALWQIPQQQLAKKHQCLFLPAQTVRTFHCLPRTGLSTCSLVWLPCFNVAKIVSPSAAAAAVSPTCVYQCVPVPLCVLSVCGMLWFLAGAKFSPRQRTPV